MTRKTGRTTNESHPVNDPEMLETLYWHEDLPMWKMAERLDVSRQTISRKMAEFKIDTRGFGPSRTTDTPVYYRVPGGYPRVDHSHKAESEQIYVHQLLAIASGANPYDVFADEYHTHHKNGVRWDNRVENIEVLTQSEHMKIHGNRGDNGSDKEYTAEELLGWIEAFVEEIGEVPTRSQMDECPGPHSVTFDSRFGSWTDAVREAGYEPRSNGGGSKYGYIASERGESA